MADDTTTKRRVMTDVRVEADFSQGLRWMRFASQEAKAKELEGLVKDFHDFLRDHRSQDMVSLNVERIYGEECSACGREWESAEEDGVVFCAYCGRTLVDEAKTEVRP